MASFTALPPELRNAIYSSLLTGPSPTLSLLRVSHQLHHEAASFFYQHNALTLSLPCAASNDPPIANKYLKYVRQLTLNIRLPRTPSAQTLCAQIILDLLAAGVELGSLTVNIASPFSAFLARRVDDTVLTAGQPVTLALGGLCARAERVRVELEGVWFGAGVVGGLRDRGGGGVEVVGAAGGGEAGVERGLSGVGMERYFGELGLGGPVEGGGAWGGDSSVLMCEVLGGLDHFSPTEFWSGDDGRWEVGRKGQCADWLDTEAVAFGAYGGNGEGEAVGDEEEELTEEDDVSDDEMLDIDDFDAILGNLGNVAQNMAAERDICFLTNFAPGVLGGW